MTIEAGTVIENPVIGDRLVFLDTGAETGGKLLRTVSPSRDSGSNNVSHPGRTGRVNSQVGQS